MLNEELLSVWLRLSGVINNQRLVTGLSFNEALVCNLLVRAARTGGSLTASELCAETRILKSQLNAILLSLERHGVISRQRSQLDRRRVELRLTPDGLDRYTAAHSRILTLIDRLVATQGEDFIRALIPMLQQVTDTFDTIQQEV